ncbi:putative LRR receptor-like serine/threonine-protein kinase [Hordeum vulgare]|nr:putative LRR receptor-like serine/threonine-protein kinase [Hordeum vulgare]
MKVATVGQLLLLALVTFSAQHVLAVSGSLSLQGNETDRPSLLRFKDAINLDPQQAFGIVALTFAIGKVSCMCRVKVPRRVASLNLTSRGLAGHISPSLGNLTSFLHSLYLMENTLAGEIPPSLGHLRRLQYLRLNNNTLQGRIPSFSNCSNLIGQFPADLPPQLHMLHLSVNNLTGTIPTSLANITTLTAITFSSNYIRGNIPSEFAELSSLQYLYAAGNQLTGSFPQAILNLSTLIGLELGINGLCGEVPSYLCTFLPNLQILHMAANFFLGHIPSSVTNASDLYKIDLSSNNFTGLVPSMIGKLTKLSSLNLEHNQVHAHSREDWNFLDSLGNCTKLQILAMSSNRLSGPIPSSLGNLSNQMQYLYLADNDLSGDFPSGIANLSNLDAIALSENHFTCVVPEWIGTLHTLQHLVLDTNNFTGVIPSSLSNLSQLGVLFLPVNRFTGQIPPSFGNFPMLQYLSIAKNSLHGRVPMEIFRIPTIFLIDLSFNNLDGDLPNNIGNAKQLQYFFLSSNKLSRDIPNTLGDCESLEAIEFDSNIFSGRIPASLGNIRSLILSNFSTNNLSGLIPPSLGNLQLLEELDLSFNRLHGEVPTKGIFNNATAVRIEGNQGLCGGVLELHMPACSVVPSHSTSHKESLVLEVVIPIASSVSLAMVIFGVLRWRGKHKTKSSSLPSFATKFPKVSFSDLARATEGFSTSKLIGRGSYGSVYQGKLVEDEYEVAVKIFNLGITGAQKSFIAECNVFRNVRHRNLVPILTACSSIGSNGNDFKALVYELMPRGDLHKLLYSNRDYEGSSYLNVITLFERINIVLDVADALEYLHHNNQGTIVHCDLKPSNILLDENMTAHVGDFGLARFKVASTTSSLGNNDSSSLSVVGTIGYAAPGGGQVSTAADVYSFGVVLLEIFIRIRPTDDMFTDGLSIVKFTEGSFPDRVLEIVDPQLLKELDETPIAFKEKHAHCLISVLNVGLCCTKTSPGERINMQEVAAKLHGIKDAYLRSSFVVSVILAT